MKRKPVSIYKPSTSVFMTLLVMYILAAATHIFIIYNTPDFTSSSIWLIWLALPLWNLIMYGTQSHVVLFEDGVEFRFGGARIFSTWENTRKITPRGIQLHEKVSPQANGLMEKLLFGRDTRWIPLAWSIDLPRKGTFRSSVNLEILLQQQFGQDLYQYAPHLFEDDNDDKSKNQLHDDSIDEAQPEWVADMSAKQKPKSKHG